METEKCPKSVDKVVSEGLRQNLKFYPEPSSSRFKALNAEQQAEAIEYFEREQERVDRLMREWEASKK